MKHFIKKAEIEEACTAHKITVEKKRIDNRGRKTNFNANGGTRD